MAEQYPYPNQEHYETPKNQIEQAQEELRLYPGRDDIVSNLQGLRQMYGNMPCLQAIEKYATIAGTLRSDSDPRVEVLNRDFYDGALLGIHVNAAPAPLDIKRRILYTDFLEHLDENPMEDEIISNITSYMEHWAGGRKNSWRKFLDGQDSVYCDVATEVAWILYEDWEDSEERQLDFMAGFAFATNLVEQTAQENYEAA